MLSRAEEEHQNQWEEFHSLELILLSGPSHFNRGYFSGRLVLGIK